VKQHLFNSDKKATTTLKQLEEKINAQTVIF